MATSSPPFRTEAIAVRGLSQKSAASPNKSPGPTIPRIFDGYWGFLETRAITTSPERIPKQYGEGSPWQKTVSPGRTVRIMAHSATRSRKVGERPLSNVSFSRDGRRALVMRQQTDPQLPQVG